MCSVLLLRDHKSRNYPTAASRVVTPGLQSVISKGRASPAKLGSSQLAALLALPALVLLAGAAIAQAEEISRPILVTGLRDAASVQTQATENLGQPLASQSPFDAAKLPPIESIGAGSDIRPFLAFSVPTDLTRAALRRAWSTDPTIRDFIGLSENSWDFDAQDGVPGFGPLTRQLMAGTTGEGESLDVDRLGTVQVPRSDQVK